MKKNSKKNTFLKSAPLKNIGKKTALLKTKFGDSTSIFMAGGAIVLITMIVLASSNPLSAKRFFDIFSRNISQQAEVNENFSEDGTDTAATNLNLSPEDQHGVVQQARAIASDNRLKFKISQFKKLAAQPLEFEIFDENGKTLKPDDLQTVNEKKVQLIIVSANLRDYQHLSPYFEGGTWKVLAKLLSPGTYYAYADITPLNKPETVLRTNLIVQQPTTGTISYPGPTVNLNSLNRGFTAQLSISKPFIYQQTLLSFQLSNKSGTAITFLRTHLGVWGHLVLFHQGDPDGFINVHSTDSANLLTQDKSNLSTLGNPAKGLVRFMTSFAQSGRYSAFVEFNIAGLIYTFPFVFDITSS